MYVCMCVCMNVCGCVWSEGRWHCEPGVRSRVYVCMYVCMYVCSECEWHCEPEVMPRAYVRLRVRTCMHACVAERHVAYVCVVHMYVYVCVCTHVHMESVPVGVDYLLNLRQSVLSLCTWF